MSKLNEYWKSYEDGTEILFVEGVQIASLQKSCDDKTFEIYVYDSDFQELFKELDGVDFINKSNAKSVVEHAFTEWIKLIFAKLTN